MPVKAGIQLFLAIWFPAFAGMTMWQLQRLYNVVAWALPTI